MKPDREAPPSLRIEIKSNLTGVLVGIVGTPTLNDPLGQRGLPTAQMFASIDEALDAIPALARQTLEPRISTEDMMRQFDAGRSR